MKARIAVRIVLGWMVALASGCVTSKVGRMISMAPNQQRVPAVVRNAAYAKTYDSLYSDAWRVPVGPPAAEISVATIEPDNYQFHYELVYKQVAEGKWTVSSKHDWKVPEHRVKRAASVRGTILLVPGYMETKEDVAHWGLRLAEAGYRAVLVDLRGQGRSTGAWITYGTREVPDLMQVVDDLQTKGLAGPRVGVLGISYGASMSLLWAAKDPRVAVVVALEPFSDARRAPMELGRATAPELASLLSDRDFDRATELAAKLGDFSWKDGDVLAAVAHLTAPVLYFHGGDDTWISADHTRRLFAQTSSEKRMGIIDHDNHVSLAIRLAPIDPEVLAWFARAFPPVATTE